MQVEAKPAPKELHGFELVQEQYLSEYNSQALLYRHKKTGWQPGVVSVFAAY